MHPIKGHHVYHWFHGTNFPLYGLPKHVLNIYDKLPKDMDKRMFFISIIGDTQISPKLHLQKIVNYLDCEKYFIVENNQAGHGIIEMKKQLKYFALCCLLENFHVANNLEQKRYYISCPRAVSRLMSILEKQDTRPTSKGNFNGKKSYSQELQDVIHSDNEPRVDDLVLLKNHWGYDKVMFARETLVLEQRYAEASFKEIICTRHGWPTLCAIVYNLWHEARFNRNNFPDGMRPLHFYLYGESRIGKTSFFESKICGKIKAHPRVMFPCNTTSDFPFTKIEQDKLPDIILLDEFEKRKIEFPDLQRIMDGSPYSANRKNRNPITWTHNGLVIFMSNHPPPSALRPFLNRFIVINGGEYKAEKLNNVFFAPNGQIFDKDGKDFTRHYLDYMYKFTNGNMNCLLDEELLETDYRAEVSTLNAGINLHDDDVYSGLLNYEVPKIAFESGSANVDPEIPTFLQNINKRGSKVKYNH